jgi:hypothetical protein
MACRMAEIMQAHAMAISLAFEQDIWLANSLITLYSKSGDSALLDLFLSY